MINVVASHVIEHVPDLIGWLKEVRAVLKPGGILSLVIPDKRFCFDYGRAVTKAADVVDAFLRGAKQPSPRHIFDHFSSAVSFNGAIAWGEVVEEQHLTQVHTRQQAWETAKTAFETATYNDVHCWVFTPASFFELLKALIEINLLDFKVEKFYDTAGCEFYVSLQALDSTQDAGDRRQMQLASLPTLELGISREQPQAQSQSTSSPTLEPISSSEQHQLELHHLQFELQKIHAEIEAMRTSKFWKLRTYWFRLKKLLQAG